MQAILVHSPHYNTDLAEFGIDKPFALDRGDLVIQHLRQLQAFKGEILRPETVTEDDIRLVHTPRYLESLKSEQTWLDIFELKANEYFPENASKKLPTLISDISIKCGGTKLACEIALTTGLAANLGGGYHHAFPDQGRGFCVLHDIAIAIKSLQKHGNIKTAMVVDLDFHQGDGTALIFQDDPTVFTLSVHSAEGWPEVKQKSDIDVELFQHEAHTYIERTEEAIDRALEKLAPDLVVYVAGSDPYEKDVLPGTRFLNLSLEVMEQRDKLVLDRFHQKQIPLAMVFAGGYGPDVWEVHYRGVRHLVALASQGSYSRSSAAC